MLALRQFWTCLLFISLAGCATSNAPSSPAGASLPVPQPSLPSEKSKASPTDIQAELSSNDVAAGALVLITLRGAVELPLSGEFEGISFSFFTAPELGPQVYEAVLGIPYE